MNTELTKSEGGGVPDWLRERSSKVPLDNLDASDLKPPRLKMLAGMSPEVMNGVPGASPGNFWITILNMNMGKIVTGIPIYRNKTYHLWEPKVPGSEQKGPLASASDGINWDVPNQVFEIKHLGNPKVYKWATKRTVAESGLSKWGTSQDDNPKSRPAATLTYDVLWLINLPTGQKQLCVFTSSRTGATPTQNFFSTTRAKGVDYFYQLWRIVSEKKTGPTGDPYFSYSYQFIDTINEIKEADELKMLHDQYARIGLATDLETQIDDTYTEQRTEGSRRDHGNPIDEDIPF